MAGLFQVLWGDKDGAFKKAEALNGTDGEPLICVTANPDFDEENASEEEWEANSEIMMASICTRPTAADINGDGNLDLVVGNASGMFFLFKGEGEGKFAPKATKIMAGKEPIRVSDTSDPCVVDWDKDGDLDIVSGSHDGGVYLSINNGSKTEAKFTPFKELVEPFDESSGRGKFGDDHINGPCRATRVWVDDVNGDGALDLVVGDSVDLQFPVKGVDEDEVAEKLKAIDAEMAKIESKMEPQMEALFEKIEELGAPKKSEEEDITKKREELEEELGKLYSSTDEIYEKRSEIVREESTGHVWVYYQKPQQVVDAKESGQSADEFKEYVAGKIQGLSDEKLDAIAKKVDSNGDGRISDEEFENRMEGVQAVMSEDSQE